jgi:hypothetical protein
VQTFVQNAILDIGVKNVKNIVVKQPMPTLICVDTYRIYHVISIQDEHSVVQMDVKKDSQDHFVMQNVQSNYPPTVSLVLVIKTQLANLKFVQVANQAFMVQNVN